MAKRKTSPKSGDTFEQRKAAQSSHARTVGFYREAVKRARTLGVEGFSAADGYDLRTHQASSDFTPAQKRKLTRLYGDTDYLFSKIHQVQRFRSAEKLQAAKEFAGHKPSKLDKRIKVAVVPARFIGEEIELVFDKNKQTKKLEVAATLEAGGKIKAINIALDYEELVTRDRDYLKELLKRNKASDKFRIWAGQHLTNIGGDKEKVINEVIKLMNKYDPKSRAGCNPNDPNSHYWGNWLHRIQQVTVKGTGNEANVRLAVRDNKLAYKAARKKQAKSYFD